MSKLRRSKTGSTVGEGQKKISSFFQTNVGCAGGDWMNGNVDKSGVQTENSKAAGPSLSVKDVSLIKTASFENNRVESVLASNVAKSQGSFSDCGEQLQIALPKNNLESQSSNENESLGKDLVVIGTPKQCAISIIDNSDCEIIPDTPEYSLPARNSNKAFGRSFLSSGSSVSFVSLENENGLPKKMVSNSKKHLQKRGHSFESRLKSKSPFNSSDRDLDHIGRDFTEFGVIDSRSAPSHSDAVNECKNISLPFSYNSEENQKSKRSSGGLSPIRKRQNHRCTPERISKTEETISNQDQVTKRLTYQDTHQNTITETASNTATAKKTLSSLRLCNDNTFTGSVSRQKQSQKAVNQSPNLDSDENLSAILSELKADFPLVSSASKPFSCHLKNKSVSQSKTVEEVQGVCANQSLFSDKSCVDDMQMAAETASSSNEEISQQLRQTDDRRTDHTNLGENIQISGNYCTETCDILIKNGLSVISTDLSHPQNTQFITEDFSQENEQMDISEIISQQEFISEGVMNLVPSSPANTKDSQSSGGSNGNLCQRFEKLSPFKTSDSSQSQDSQTLQTIHPPPFHKFNRHRVVSVVKNRNETVVELECAVGNINRVAVLHGFWHDTAVRSGDIMNIIGSFDDTNTCHVTDRENFVIMNPDRLISGTTIVSSLHCMRRSVLNEKFKSSGKSSPFMLYGSIIHTIFQMILVNRMQSKDAIRSAVDTVVQQSAFLHEMYAQGMKEQALRSEIEKYLPQIETFVNSYFRPDNSLTSHFCEQKTDIVVTDVRDIEENIWSPRYGIKGKVDLTVNVKIHNRKTKLVEQKVVPLELKTGKTSFSAEHQGQVTLYTMMFADRRTDPEAGLLVYLKDLSMKLIPANYSNKRGLIQLRNELAFYLRQSLEKVDCAETVDSFGIDSVPWTIGSLPNPLNSERTCSNCEQLINCSLYQQSIEHRSLNQTMAGLVPATLAHLSPLHLGFFSLWCKMLHLEMSLEVSRKEGAAALWMHTSQERELKGECLSGLALIRDECQTLSADSFVHVFERCATQKSSVPLNDVGILVNDSLVVSSENGTYLALATGVVTHIDENRVILATERDLRKYKECSETIYRLDKCDTFNSTTINLSNLSRLMENTNSSKKLRQLVIERRSPEFNLTLSKSVIQKVRHIMKDLNKPQQTAILKVLMTKDYVLIKGYPGTGKTSTIVAIIRILVICGLSVLLTSYTHSAVDNILLKLIPHKVDFLRIGRLDRIHSSIHAFAAERLTDRFKTVADLAGFYHSKPVIATTCLGINHPIFSQRTFDVCIVDEASQVLLPACLGPLYLASRFILVGDPKQLPPVVQSREARDLGLGQSLFSVLDEVGGAAYELNLQYRMNSEIMRLSNSLIYEGALQCGSSAVALSRLEIRNPSLKGEIGEWQEKCLSSETDFAVMWLNTDTISSPDFQENSSHSSVKSNVEANVVLELVQLFVRAGVIEDDIGVITPFRHQVKVLRQKLERSDLSHTEVNTIDQYQGRDKCVIIVSFVKSYMPDSKVSEILKDPRRVNVALTRAKHKMIFVGSVTGLVIYEPLRQLLQNILRPNQIYDVTCLAADV